MTREKFQGKYKNGSFRMQNWDYSFNGSYFITIITKNRRRFFGSIAEGKMNLSEIGMHAHACWMEIPKHFPFVLLDAFVVMPDHIHGIIIINKPIVELNSNCVLHQPNIQNHNNTLISNEDLKSLSFMDDSRNSRSWIKNEFGPQSKNLASIIRGFKVGVTKIAKQIDDSWSWQPLYHDKIIRDRNAFLRIRKYIIENPGKWDK